MITIHQRNQKFPMMMMRLSAICSKYTSLSFARQIYHWPAHNLVNLEFAYFLSFFLPSTNMSLSEKYNVLFSLVTNNSPMNRLFNVKFLLISKSHVKYIPLLCQIWPTLKQKSSLFYQQSLGMIQTHVPNSQFSSLFVDKALFTVQLITYTVS